MSKEQLFKNLRDCYWSGQMNEKQWQQHLKDTPGLAEWMARRR